MKEIRPGVWVDYDLHFNISKEEQEWVDKKNDETREIFKKFLTELQANGRMVPIITVDVKY